MTRSGQQVRPHAIVVGNSPGWGGVGSSPPPDPGLVWEGRAVDPPEVHKELPTGTAHKPLLFHVGLEGWVTPARAGRGCRGSPFLVLCCQSSPLVARGPRSPSGVDSEGSDPAPRPSLSPRMEGDTWVQKRLSLNE